MIRRYGNMFDTPLTNPDDPFVVTTNSFIKRNSDLVMGRGAALEATQRFPRLASDLGHNILTAVGHLGTYNLIAAFNYPVLAFQVKHHFKDAASIELIRESAEQLAFEAAGSQLTYHLNYPGIGNGRLSFNSVANIITNILPNTVHVWTFN